MSMWLLCMFELPPSNRRCSNKPPTEHANNLLFFSGFVFALWQQHATAANSSTLYIYMYMSIWAMHACKWCACVLFIFHTFKLAAASSALTNAVQIRIVCLTKVNVMCDAKIDKNDKCSCGRLAASVNPHTHTSSLPHMNTYSRKCLFIFSYLCVCVCINKQVQVLSSVWHVGAEIVNLNL